MLCACSLNDKITYAGHHFSVCCLSPFFLSLFLFPLPSFLDHYHPLLPMADASAIPTDISAITKALAVPEVLSYILITAGKRYLPKFRLVSHSFLQACAPYFFIRIPEHHFCDKRPLSSDHLQIIQSAGRLLRSLSLINDDSTSFDAFATSL